MNGSGSSKKILEAEAEAASFKKLEAEALHAEAIKTYSTSLVGWVGQKMAIADSNSFFIVLCQILTSLNEKHRNL